MKVLELKDVQYSYNNDKRIVLNNINAIFEKGKMYAIMGKSGSGKSTLLSLLAGLDNTTFGNILYHDIDIAKLQKDDYRAKSVGVIFQGYNLINNMNSIQNIVLSMDIGKSTRKDKESHAYTLLDLVGINKESAKRKVLNLSGGEQQRVGIARAIAHNPDVVIADEPTGNLDEETQGTILEILKYLAHEQNKCVIVVTHSKEVGNYADELYGLDNGVLNYIK